MKRNADERRVRSRVGVTLLVASGLALSACGGGTDPDPQASSAATAGDAPATGTQTEAAAPAAGGTPSAAEVCAYLEQELPTLKGMSEVGAMSQVTVGIADLWGDQLEQLGNADLDGMTSAECPQVRSGILDAIGLESFSAL